VSTRRTFSGRATLSRSLSETSPNTTHCAIVRKRPGHLVCKTWEQASHNGELVHAVEAGAIGRDQVTELGAVLTGEALGRGRNDEITAFDSTGLAIQDLAVALAALERYEAEPNSDAFEGVSTIEVV
jgi:alanine dehydrogenase